MMEKSHGYTPCSASHCSLEDFTVLRTNQAYGNNNFFPVSVLKEWNRLLTSVRLCTSIFLNLNRNENLPTHNVLYD